MVADVVGFVLWLVLANIGENEQNINTSISYLGSLSHLLHRSEASSHFVKSFSSPSAILFLFRVRVGDTGQGLVVVVVDTVLNICRLQLCHFQWAKA